MTSTLSGKVAFVTGGARGIGSAIVHRLAREGAAVAFTYQNSAAGASKLVAAIEAAGGRAIAIKADVADAAALTSAIDDAAHQLGRIDILVSSAGVALLGTLDSFSLQDFDKTIAVNVRAVFAGQGSTAAYARGRPHHQYRQLQRRAHAFPRRERLAMSKSALQGLVQALARDLGPKALPSTMFSPARPTRT
jgi:3-oxoacyl-[acyl-carrier protein] reductase